MSSVKGFFERLQKGEQPVYRRYWYLIILLFIVLTAFWFRSFPARYGELQALDPFYFYRASEIYMNNGFQLPELDMMRDYPAGYGWDYFMPIALPPIVYTIFTTLGMQMTYLDFAIIYPALLGALAVLIFYFVGKELWNYKVGLFAAFFLAVIPAFISRTSAGFFEKESISAVFMFLSIYFFIRAFKKGDWKSGILSGIFLAGMAMSWGGVQYLFFIYSLFALVLLILNRNVPQLLKAFIPAVIIGALLPSATYGFMTFSPTSTPAIVSFAMVAVLLIRYLAERYSLIKKEQMPYLVPALIVIGFVGLLIASMFSDAAFNMIQYFVEVFQFEKGVALSTVAESIPGSWGDITGRTGTMFVSGFSTELGYIAPYFSLWIFMLLGILISVYTIFKQRKWLLFLPLFWIIISIWGALFQIRLVFLLGPPAALLGGYFFSWFIDLGKIKKLAKVSILIVIFVALMVIINTVNGYQFSQYEKPSICFADNLKPGEKCLIFEENGTYTYGSGQHWYEAMTFLATQTAPNSSVISWWDFGYWFQTRGYMPTVADGGGASPRYKLAEWYTANTDDWDEFEPWLKEKAVSTILMDATLPGKYGAISKIASRGEEIVGIMQFYNSGYYPQGNKTVYELTSGPYAIWLPIEGENITGTPMFLISQNGQYLQKAYINDVCTPAGILKMGDEDQTIGGCVAVTNFGVFYIPEEAKNNIFTSLMFMEGAGLPVEKTFDNGLAKIYKVIY